eukprot:TRINITY_DN18326_c0_g1_i1.p2 TRINITY_DN18326_c0_g1~~TRINITY_DN18326_c0_g1_i1.p2  ORF type:complete len:105 (-),score=5.16 TRINITY_DN18326_c0_g1_i1:57-371(-)
MLPGMGLLSAIPNVGDLRSILMRRVSFRPCGFTYLLLRCKLLFRQGLRRRANERFRKFCSPRAPTSTQKSIIFVSSSTALLTKSSTLTTSSTTGSRRWKPDKLR